MHSSSSLFHKGLYSKVDIYAHQIYRLTKNFPIEERFGITSQLRRASLSIILNYIEGYARQNSKVYKNFLDISYGSLRESQYLLNFTKEEQIIDEQEFEFVYKLGDEIGAMLWRTIQSIRN